MTEAKLRETTLRAADHHAAVLGRSVVLRGELSGNEDLLLQGQFEGRINLGEHCLTIGPGGQVKADIRAGQVMVHGSVEGNIAAHERIAIHKTGRVVGDLQAAAIAIEEGGYFKGSIDILREGERSQAPASRAPESEPARRGALGSARSGESQVPTPRTEGEAAPASDAAGGAAPAGSKGNET